MWNTGAVRIAGAETERVVGRYLTRGICALLNCVPETRSCLFTPVVAGLACTRSQLIKGLMCRVGSRPGAPIHSVSSRWPRNETHLTNGSLNSFENSTVQQTAVFVFRDRKCSDCSELPANVSQCCSSLIIYVLCAEMLLGCFWTRRRVGWTLISGSNWQIFLPSWILSSSVFQCHLHLLPCFEVCWGHVSANGESCVSYSGKERDEMCLQLRVYRKDCTLLINNR